MTVKGFSNFVVVPDASLRMRSDSIGLRSFKCKIRNVFCNSFSLPRRFHNLYLKRFFFGTQKSLVS